MKITLKLYYQGQIRRRTINTNEIRSYDELEAKICQILKIMPNLCIRYVDEDEDLITIAHNEDLENCLELLEENDVLKIRVAVRNNAFRGPVYNVGLVDLHRVGMAMMKEGHYARARVMFLRLADVDVENETALYNAACAASCGGDLETACMLLNKSVDAGFDDVVYMEADSDFENIRELEAYKQIVKRLSGDEEEKVEVPCVKTVFNYLEVQNEAFDLMDKGTYEDLTCALDKFALILEHYPNDRYATYNVACCYSLMGHLEKSVDKLYEAISLGYDNYEHMAKDEDLAQARLLANFPSISNSEEESENDTVEEESETDDEEESETDDETEVIEPVEETEVYVKCEAPKDTTEDAIESETAETQSEDLDEGIIEILTVMGFSTERAKLALIAADYDTNRAVEILLGCN